MHQYHLVGWLHQHIDGPRQRMSTALALVDGNEHELRLAFGGLGGFAFLCRALASD